MRQRVDGEMLNIVEEHNKTVELLGQVALGKFGRPLSEKSMRLIQWQLAQSLLTKVIVISRSTEGYRGYAAEIERAGYTTSQPPPFPSYYRRLRMRPTTYFLLKNRLSEVSIDNLTLGNGRLVSLSLPRTRTVFMLATEGPPKR